MLPRDAEHRTIVQALTLKALSPESKGMRLTTFVCIVFNLMYPLGRATGPSLDLFVAGYKHISQHLRVPQFLKK